MKVSEISIDRRDFIKAAIGGTILAYLTLTTTSDIARVLPTPRIIPHRIPRTIGRTKHIPITDTMYRTLDRISINSNPLDKGQIESIPMIPVDCKKYCKSNPDFPIETKKFGILMPKLFEKLKMDFKAKPGQLILRSNDWYALVPGKPEETFFSACRNNIDEDYWEGKGLEQAAKAKLTPYGFFTPDEFAWRDIADGKDITILKEGEIKPGNYFIGPNGNIIQPENKDVSMSLDSLVLSIAGRKIPYSKIKKYAENHPAIYKGKEMPSILFNELLELANVDISQKNKALILHANNYAVSIPPWRQDNLIMLFDKSFANKYGVPTKLVGGIFLNKAAQLGGFYKAEVMFA